ncbi:MerR family transcriptional regulator [Planobispora rosea]|uniref:MerR family transcriptional regulator n=1 Tax=Planobispora rosea TaxID=35762 RepID=A0A8J3WFX3_PLARO|nr:MerR family transcriptional regulator [Planobispora rosea]GGS92740.1 MerR family transcriptional regulator [Planobispora rosea]GIH87227.1 MerR family transcriptional regulator [Planobispora rosea]
MGITIQEASRVSGLSTHTLRYYERIGLIHEVGRDSGGRRSYTRPDLDWLDFLTKLRTTGMPIAEMCRYAELRRRGPATAAERRRMLEIHRARVLERIAQLSEDLSILDYKIDLYHAMENS